ncbi:hypothetical protein RB594_007155 [Gaeumannomyces avenae]
MELWRSLFLWPCVAAFYWARILADALTSQLFEVLAIVFSLLWGALKLFDLRGYSPALYEEESKFTFGQVLPVLLLVGSAFSASSSFLCRLLNKIPTSDSTKQPSPASGDDTMIPTSDTAEQVGLATTEKEWDLNTAISNDCYASNSWFGPCVVFLILQFTVSLYVPLIISVARSQPRSSYTGYESQLSNRPNQLHLGLQILLSLLELLPPLLVAIPLDQIVKRSRKKSKTMLIFVLVFTLSLLSKFTLQALLAVQFSYLESFIFASCPLGWFGVYALIVLFDVFAHVLLQTAIWIGNRN